jgi:glutathione synthase/RimK-type ligase-like ATP-grasp enzyme
MKVLCIGSASDQTFVHTLASLRSAGLPFDALDLGQLALSGGIDIPWSDPLRALFTLHGRQYRLDAYSSVFIRTTGLVDAAPSQQLRCRAAAQAQAISQLLSSAPLLVVNPPGGELSNAAKLFQGVTLAAETGWLIPRSCLTARPDTARAFVASCPAGVIYKGGSGAKTWVRLFGPEDEARLHLLTGCPVLFQERIDGPDVRIHVIGERCFGEMIEAAGPDYRRARGNRFSPLAVPPEIAAGCVLLTRVCKRPFLGIDFRIQRESGEWYFLEANPQPGYSYYDQRADGAIGRALAEFLAAGTPLPEQHPLPPAPTPLPSRPPLPDTWPLNPAAGVTLELLDNELVLSDPEGARGYFLNETALAIWELCDGRRTVAGVARDLAHRYGLDPADLLEDVRAVVRELAEHGFLAGRDEHGDDEDEYHRQARRFLRLTQG